MPVYNVTVNGTYITGQDAFSDTRERFDELRESVMAVLLGVGEEAVDTGSGAEVVLRVNANNDDAAERAANTKVSSALLDEKITGADFKIWSVVAVLAPTRS
jgi:N-acetylglutamate synthase/N-acetylornithine aminotransferase